MDAFRSLWTADARRALQLRKGFQALWAACPQAPKGCCSRDHSHIGQP